MTAIVHFPYASSFIHCVALVISRSSCILESACHHSIPLKLYVFRGPNLCLTMPVFSNLSHVLNVLHCLPPLKLYLQGVQLISIFPKCFLHSSAACYRSSLGLGLLHIGKFFVITLFCKGSNLCMYIYIYIQQCLPILCRLSLCLILIMHIVY